MNVKIDRLVAAGLITIVIALAATDLLLACVADFWRDHAMFASLLSSGVLLGLTVAVVDEVMRRREADRWAFVAGAAYRELSTAAFAVVADILVTAGAVDEDPSDDDPTTAIRRSEQYMWRTLSDPATAVAFATERIYPHTEQLGQEIARWAPVLLGYSEGAEGLDRFARMRDELISMTAAIHEDDPHGAFEQFNRFSNAWQAFDEEWRRVDRMLQARVRGSRNARSRSADDG